MMAADWSDLASDMLAHVSSFLPLPDHHRFCAVCHHWRSVAREKHHPRPAPELPWLVLGEDPASKKRNFFNLSEQRHYSIDIPELRGRFVCGSSHGWLVAIDDRINGRLLNPFTREFYDLPPFPPYSAERETVLTEEPVFTSCGARTGLTFREMQSLIVARAVLSNDPRDGSDFTLMILCGGTRKLALWRPGDAVWTMVRCPLKSLIGLVDVICFQGKFYAVSQGKLYAVEMEETEPEMMIIKPRLPRVSRTPTMVYLADFKGKLLLVMRFISFREPIEEEYRVFCLDQKKGAWNELDGEDKIALFVGNNPTVLLDPSKFCGSVADAAIYFADMLSSQYWLQRGHALGVYNMVNGTIGRFCPNDDTFHPLDAALTWLTPS